MEDFTRAEVQAIWGRAAEKARSEMNPVWQIVYSTLAYDLCVLDAFMARAETLAPPKEA